MSQSQQSLIEDIASWTPEQCRSQLDHALPKLIQYLNEAGALDRESEILQLIYQCFLPVVTVEFAENKLLSKVVHKTAKCFDVSLSTIHQVASEADHQIEAVTDQVLRLLQIGTSLIGCLTSCISHMVQVEGSLDMGQVHSLPANVLHVVERSYTHCKESSNVYGELLGAVSEQLSVLFRQANNLQMALISLLEKVHIGVNSCEQDVQDMVTAIHGLFEISQVAADLEVKVMLTLWKAISRLSCQHKDVLCNRLELDQMVSALATDMITTYEYLFALPPDGEADKTGIQRRVKILGFQMRVMQMLVKEFDGYLGDGIPQVCNLILVLQRNVSPSVAASNSPPQLVEEVEKQVVIGLGSLIVALISSRHFVQRITASTLDVKPGLYLPHLLTLVTVLDHLPSCEEDVQNQWLVPEDEPRDGILKAVFKSFARCFIELGVPVTLPGVMCNGKPQRSVSLYEHVVTRLCGFVASFPSSIFSVLETTLLENVLGRQTYPAFLAMDVWCFLARYGTADVCRDHCVLIAQILGEEVHGPTPQCCHLVELLRRLLRFMAPEHQEDFVHMFPVDKHPKLWSVMPLAIFTPALLSKIVSQTVAMTTQVLALWLTSLEKKVLETQNLVSHLQLLSNVYSSTGVAEHHLTSDHQNIVNKCTQLWAALPPDGVVRYAVLHGVVIALYQIMSNFTDKLDSKHILQLLLKTSRILDQRAPLSLRLAILHFLSNIGGRTFEPSSEQSQILAELPGIFQRLLADDNAVVHHMALGVFARFAEETPHESIVPDSINSRTCLQDAVVAYLQQLESGGGSTQDKSEIVTHLKEANVKVTTYLSSSPADLYPPIHWPSQGERVRDREEPAAQNPKDSGSLSVQQVAPSHSDDTGQVGYSKALQMVRESVSQLSVLRRQGAFPSWFQQELQVVHMQLSEYL